MTGEILNAKHKSRQRRGGAGQILGGLLMSQPGMEVQKTDCEKHSAEIRPKVFPRSRVTK